MWTTDFKPPTPLDGVVHCGPNMLVFVIVHPTSPY
jgi:hypothetical protein